MNPVPAAILCLTACLCLLAGGCTSASPSQREESSTVEQASVENSDSVSDSIGEISPLSRTSSTASLSSEPVEQTPESGSESPQKEDSPEDEEVSSQTQILALEDLQNSQGAFVLSDVYYGMPSLLFLQQNGLPLTTSGVVWNVPAIGDDPGYTMIRYQVCQVELLGSEFQYQAVFKDQALNSVEFDLEAGPEEDLRSLYQQLYEAQKELYGIDKEWEVGASQNAQGIVLADRTILFVSQESDGESSTYLQGTVNELDGKIVRITLSMGQDEAS